MKRKLITKVDAENFVVCDNPKCNFKINCDEVGLTIPEFLNVACPECGENLLTEDDYVSYLNLMKFVDWVNKWFSWITIFYSKNRLENKSKASLHVHEGVKITPIKQ